MSKTADRATLNGQADKLSSCSVTIQRFSQSVPASPCWFGETVLLVQHIRQQGVLEFIMWQVHFARRRLGRYDLIVFMTVLFGYASAFMALFGRGRLPSRSALSRFLAALTPEPVEALRTLFLDDLLTRTVDKDEPLGGLWGSRRHTLARF